MQKTGIRRGLAGVLIIFLLIAGNALAQDPPQGSGAHKGKHKQQVAATTDKQSSDHQPGTDNMPLAVKVVATPPDHPETEEQKQQRETKEAIDKRLADATDDIARFTKNLVTMGIIAAGIGIGQLALFFGQWLIMGRSLADAKSAIKAARDSAKAARLNAQAVITAERAYVTMSHIPPGLDFKRPNGIAIKMDVKNYGRTPARITDIYFGPYQILPLPDSIKNPDIKSFEILLAQGEVNNASANFDMSIADMDEISSGKKPLWICGYVDYIDIFGDRHRSGYARIYALDSRNNLHFETKKGYNYDRKRNRGEGNDWD